MKEHVNWLEKKNMGDNESDDVTVLVTTYKSSD